MESYELVEEKRNSTATTKSTKCLILIGAVTLLLTVLASVTLTGFLFYQVKNLQMEIQGLALKDNFIIYQEELTPEAHSRKERRVPRSSRIRLSAFDEEINSNNVKPFVSYIRWGRPTCTRGKAITTGSRAIISGVHGDDGSVSSGSNVFCVTNPNEISGSDKNVNEGHNLEPLEFDLHGHASAFTRSDKSGHLHCALCEVQGSDVITMIGNTMCPDRWDQIYKGILVSTIGSAGTTASICIDDEPMLVNNNLFSKSSRRMAPLKSGTRSPFLASGKEVPCIVCFRDEFFDDIIINPGFSSNNVRLTDNNNLRLSNVSAIVSNGTTTTAPVLHTITAADTSNNQNSNTRLENTRLDSSNLFDAFDQFS